MEQLYSSAENCENEAGPPGSWTFVARGLLAASLVALGVMAQPILARAVSDAGWGVPLGAVLLAGTVVLAALLVVKGASRRVGLISALILAASILISASLVETERGSYPTSGFGGVSGTFFAILIASARLRLGWPLVAATLILGAGLVMATIISAG